VPVLILISRSIVWKKTSVLFLKPKPLQCPGQQILDNQRKLLPFPLLIRGLSITNFSCRPAFYASYKSSPIVASVSCLAGRLPRSLRAYDSNPVDCRLGGGGRARMMRFVSVTSLGSNIGSGDSDRSVAADSSALIFCLETSKMDGNAALVPLAGLMITPFLSLRTAEIVSPTNLRYMTAFPTMYIKFIVLHAIPYKGMNQSKPPVEMDTPAETIEKKLRTT
jgi:hypothetical protein